MAGAHWPASLACLMNSRLMRDHISNEMDGISEADA